ncbi:hypothetical protein EMIHUDRAFT_458509, partial [Emiliania huxleyi CCMP1516]|uniref:MBD domain-containing protein n=2 Tax=Emiliania huxleyi TaxID=2903 RepID=A0A0D3JB77_EMIH1
MDQLRPPPPATPPDFFHGLGSGDALELRHEDGWWAGSRRAAGRQEHRVRSVLYAAEHWLSSREEEARWFSTPLAAVPASAAVVPQPLDYGTVRRRLRDGVYGDEPLAFANDGGAPLRKLAAFLVACGGQAGLVDGWTTTQGSRVSGVTAGTSPTCTSDLYYLSPLGARFRSRREVARHFALDDEAGLAALKAAAEARVASRRADGGSPAPARSPGNDAGAWAASALEAATSALSAPSLRAADEPRAAEAAYASLGAEPRLALLAALAEAEGKTSKRDREAARSAAAAELLRLGAPRRKKAPPAVPGEAPPPVPGEGIADTRLAVCVGRLVARHSLRGPFFALSRADLDAAEEALAFELALQCAPLDPAGRR